ncbi:hypothetical protein ACFXTI_006694 [Malus domestica]
MCPCCLRACMHLVSDSAPAVFCELVPHRRSGHSLCPGKHPDVPPALSYRLLNQTRRRSKNFEVVSKVLIVFKRKREFSCVNIRVWVDLEAENPSLSNVLESGFYCWISGFLDDLLNIGVS